MADEQAKVWNGTSGRAWTRHADDFDEVLAPFGRAAMDVLDLGPGSSVLDVGCGTGATARELARRVAPGRVTGIDISEPMLDEARARTSAERLGNVEFVHADVEQLDPSPGSHDAVFSRFGVMFFGDPERAFANLAAAVRGDGELGFICFKGPGDNPFIAVPLLTAAAHVDLGELPPPDSPGPFSLADPDRIRSILGAAGWTDVVVTDGPDRTDMGPAGDPVGLAWRVLEQNPLSCRALERSDPEQRNAAVDAVAAALAGHAEGDRIRMGAGTWVVHARRP